MAVNIDRLRELIVGGLNKKQIMDQLDIKNHPSLNSALINLMQHDDKVYKIKGGRSISESKTRTFKTSPKGSITLPSKYLSLGGFQPGDTFQGKIRGSKVILTKLEDES